MNTCSTCVWWRREAKVLARPGWHLCQKMESTNGWEREYGDAPGPVQPDTLAYAGTGEGHGEHVYTAPTFACVMWQDGAGKPYLSGVTPS